MSKSVKHISWDFDGTIVDSFAIYRRSVEIYCQRRSLNVPNDRQLRRSFGSNNWKGFSCWPLPLELQEEHRRNIYSVYYEIERNSPEEVPLVAGLGNIMEDLKKKKVVQSIITSRRREPLNFLLKFHNIAKYFSTYNTGDCARELNLADKPSPDKLRYLNAIVGASPEDTVVVGDTRFDIIMAHAAGARAIAVSWGMGERTELKRAGADVVIDNGHNLTYAIYSALNPRN